MRHPALRGVFLASSFLLVLSLSPSAFAQTIIVTSANPNNASQGTVNLNVLINGQGFKKGAISKFFISGTADPGGITVNSTSFISSGQLNANINVAANATPTLFDIVVTLTDGRSGKGTKIFAVTVPDPAIAFTDRTHSTLWVMNADGTSQTQILKPPNPKGSQHAAAVYRPNWSPDGKQLVFETTLQGDGIYVINKDGSGLRKVIGLSNGSGLSFPAWSPAPAADGNWKIAFADQPTGLFQENLFLVNLDGTGLVNLTKSIESEYYPTWDPYATRLAAQVYPCPPNQSCTPHLYEYSLGLVNGVVGIAGTTDLTAAGPLQSANIYEPQWATTQDKIVLFARPLSHLNDSAIWIVSLADPSNPVELVPTFDNGYDPSWSPDDTKIVYGRNIVNKATISTISANGSAITDLAYGIQPAWRRCCPACTTTCPP